MHANGAHLVVIEVPMSSAMSRYRQSAAGQRYRGWLQSELAVRGRFVDMSAPQSVHDQNFSDGVHLDQAGAEAFPKTWEKLAPLLGQQQWSGNH